jgi:hypothetical protein
MYDRGLFIQVECDFFFFFSLSLRRSILATHFSPALGTVLKQKIKALNLIVSRRMRSLVYMCSSFGSQQQPGKEEIEKIGLLFFPFSPFFTVPLLSL